jgi:hypothetical protein
MRKLFFILITIAIISGVILSQEIKPDPTKQKSSIKITYPKAGVILNTSTLCLIQWERPGIQNIKAKITLLKPRGGKVKVIAYNADNTGKYSWTIPFNLPEGSYKIEVKAGTIADTSEMFTIKVPQLSLYEPHADEVLTIGQDKVIRWNASNAEGVRIQIHLQKLKFPSFGDMGIPLASNIKADDGEYTWTVGKYDNGSKDLWNLTSFPEQGAKCQIEIYLQGSLAAYSPLSSSKEFRVKK